MFDSVLLWEAAVTTHVTLCNFICVGVDLSQSVYLRNVTEYNAKLYLVKRQRETLPFPFILFVITLKLQRYGLLFGRHLFNTI